MADKEQKKDVKRASPVERSNALKKTAGRQRIPGSGRGISPLGLSGRLIDTSSQAVVVTDADGEIIYVNGAFLEMSGFNGDELSGHTAHMLFSERNDNETAGQIAGQLRSGNWQGEAWGIKKSGEEYPAWISISVLRDDSRKITNYAAFVFDITMFKQNEQRLELMAHYDILTNLPNRSLMYDRLNQALRLARRHRLNVAVMLLDIDRFKEINDTLGHHIGDQLLVEASRRLVSCVRESDTVARMGGDEFLIILPEVKGARSTAQLAQKFLDALSSPFTLDGNEAFITASIGISMYPTDSKDVHVIVKNADTAMYHAKAQGKNNYKFFTEDINKSTIDRFVLESRFRRALEKLEFQLNYQPKVDIDSGRITGMEALLRWYHPEQGNVNPELFIPLAEETGLVVQLSEWALKEACRQNKEWQDEGLPDLRISVNLSAKHFHKKELPDLICSVLEETRLDPKYLMIEITERTIIENVVETIQILHKLRKMGIGISVDDFGTGYSSLNYLNRFPIDELKIDKSFIDEILKDHDSRKVISAIIALAHNLNLKVVAEGVETAEQYEFLRDGRCNEMQGYYYSRPLSSHDFRRLIMKGLTLKQPASGR